MINKEMTIYEALQVKPGCEEVLFRFGMHCLGCAIAREETLEEAAMAHEIDLDALLEALENFGA